MAISQTEFAADLEAMEKGLKEAIAPFMDKYGMIPDLEIVTTTMMCGKFSDFLRVRVTSLRDVRA